MSKIGRSTQSVAPHTYEAATISSVKKQGYGRAAWLLLIPVFFILVVGGSLLYYWHSHRQTGVPASISKVQLATPFPLFYPTPLPNGFTFRPDQALTGNTAAVFFKLRYGNKDMVITEQAKPNDFDFTGFYQAQLSGETNFTTSVGKATYGSFGSGEGVLASVEGSKTWLIVQAPQGIEIPKLKELLANLREVSP